MSAQSTLTPHYRAFWVDTFNTPLNNHADIVRVVENCKAANANAVFAQVRRRGDAWYLNSLEPPADRVPLAPDFDPLGDLIAEAHRSGIEVHAFVIVGAIWNRDPQSFPPVAANHVFNRHGFNPSTNSIYEGSANWLTRTLLPDVDASDGSRLISYNGHRIGAEFWIDPGHPDAVAYTVEVLAQLVRNYDLDGLHLDRIRYPELSIPGQTPTTGANIGYNQTSVNRFQRHYGIAAGSPPPAPNDPRWSLWRRQQVTNLVRRIYLNALALKPNLKVSAALIAFGNGPRNDFEWPLAEAFWRVYQDWRAWTEEGILDIAVPMNYKAEHTAAGRAAYDTWNEWIKNRAYNRATMIGQGAFVNAIEGSLQQTRRALTPSGTGNSSSGVIFYSMATSNIAVNSNPYSLPPGQSTARRSFAEFASALTTGKSLDQTVSYEDSATNPTAVFSAPVAPPTFAWKTAPQVGFLMGTIKYANNEVVDAGDVVVSRTTEQSANGAGGRSIVRTVTDGGGFYGAVDLTPGTYRLHITPAGQATYTTETTIEVVANQVKRFDAILGATPSDGGR